MFRARVARNPCDAMRCVQPCTLCLPSSSSSLVKNQERKFFFCWCLTQGTVTTEMESQKLGHKLSGSGDDLWASLFSPYPPSNRAGASECSLTHRELFGLLHRCNKQALARPGPGRGGEQTPIGAPHPIIHRNLAKCTVPRKMPDGAPVAGIQQQSVAPAPRQNASIPRTLRLLRQPVASVQPRHSFRPCRGTT